jgi:hypothetical protein
VTSSNSATTDSQTLNNSTDLAPSYRIPLVLIGFAIPLGLVQIWLGAVVGLFGLFLSLQALTLTLRFTESALDIYRGEKLIRRFPYAEWEYWEFSGHRYRFCFTFGKSTASTFCPLFLALRNFVAA